MTDTIFDGATTIDPSTVTPSTQPTIPQELVDFVGAGKKYASLEEAAKSVPFAQKHITTLEEELARVKEDLTKRKTAEELLEDIRKAGTPTVATTTQVGALTPEQLASAVDNALTSREQASVKKNNTAQVVSVFTTTFGDKAESMFKQIAEENGLSIQSLNSLAATSPSIVLKLAGLNKKDTPLFKPNVTINTQTFNTDGSPQVLSAKVKSGASTKDILAGWHIAGKKVGKQT